MALPTGTISFSDLRSEYGPYYNNNGPISLGQLYRRPYVDSPGIPSSTANPYWVKGVVTHPSYLQYKEGGELSSYKSQSEKYCRIHLFPQPETGQRAYVYRWGSTSWNYAEVPWGFNPKQPNGYHVINSNQTMLVYPLPSGYTFTNSNKGRPPASVVSNPDNARATAFPPSGPTPYGYANFQETCKVEWHAGYTENPNQGIPEYQRNNPVPIKMSNFRGKSQPSKYPSWVFPGSSKYIIPNGSPSGGYAATVPQSWGPGWG